MKKIIKLLGSVLISTSIMPYDMFVKPNIEQKKLLSTSIGRKTGNIIAKFLNLHELKVALDVKRENILYFEDQIGNIFYEDEDNIYMWKSDWLSWPVKLNEIESKVNVIVGDIYNNVYFGTENGIYKRNVLSNKITKIQIAGTDQAINFMLFDKNNKFYVGTKENVYILNEITNTLTPIFFGWVIGLSVDNKNNLYIAAKNGVYKLTVGTEKIIQLPNPHDFDENELVLMFPRVGTNLFNINWDCEYAKLWNLPLDYGKYKNDRLTLEVLYNFKLGTINPLYYNKFKFLGSDFSRSYSKISWGNDAFYGNKPSDFNGTELKEKILNKKLYSNDFIVFDNNNLSKIFKVQDFYKSYSWGNKIWGKQFFILSYYFENGNYYLQFSVAHNVLTKGPSHSGGGIWMNFGYGISLYND